MEKWKQAEKDFRDHFTRYGKSAVVGRFSDTAEAKASGGKNALLRAQPSDFLVTLKGNTFFAEVKSCEKSTSFPHGNIQPTQLAKSRQITKAGGTYLFFIKSEFHDQWFAVPAEVIYSAGRKSTPWDSIQQYRWNINGSQIF